LLSLFFDPEDGSDVLPNRRFTFTGLHGVISQKTEFFLATAVRFHIQLRGLHLKELVCSRKKPIGLLFSRGHVYTDCRRNITVATALLRQFENSAPHGSKFS
jgi:hypothetical protein